METNTAPKKARNRTEFIVTTLAGMFAGGLSLGVVDISPDTIQKVADGVTEITQSSTDPMDMAFRIVALLVGGYVVGKYTDGRNQIKKARIENGGKEDDA